MANFGNRCAWPIRRGLVPYCDPLIGPRDEPLYTLHERRRRNYRHDSFFSLRIRNNNSRSWRLARAASGAVIAKACRPGSASRMRAADQMIAAARASSSRRRVAGPLDREPVFVKWMRSLTVAPDQPQWFRIGGRLNGNGDEEG